MNLVAGAKTFPVPARFNMSLARSEDMVEGEMDHFGISVAK